MKLSPRLKMVADMVRPGVVVADIGTDHAYLPIYLLQNGICPGAIASDVRQGPLENAGMSVLSAGFTDKIDVRASDGLERINSHEVQDIILAGMGGNLIVRLLACTPWLCDSQKRLILQPMTHAESVREYLCKNGFKILFEQACFEGQRAYISMCVCYQESPTPCLNPAYYFIGELPACGSVAASKYIEKIYKRLSKRASALATSGSNPQEAEHLQGILKEILEATI